MDTPTWPDPLQPTDPQRVQTCLAAFWRQLASLADLLPRRQLLLASEQVSALRALVLEMMLALNGIAYPHGTAHLNRYLGASQRAALEKTLLLPEVSPEAITAQAVALVTIYRWYAPQLLERYGGDYPHQVEADTWQELTRQIADWPLQVTTDE